MSATRDQVAATGHPDWYEASTCATCNGTGRTTGPRHTVTCGLCCGYGQTYQRKAVERTFTLIVPVVDLHNSNHRRHWSVVARKARAQRDAARSACADLEPLPGPVALTVTFGFPDHRRRDLDNYSIKAAIDGAVDAGVLTDDRSTVLRSVTRQPSDSLTPKGYAVLTFTFRPAGGEA